METTTVALFAPRVDWVEGVWLEVEGDEDGNWFWFFFGRDMWALSLSLSGVRVSGRVQAGFWFRMFGFGWYGRMFMAANASC